MSEKKRTSLYYGPKFMDIVDDWRTGPGRKLAGKVLSRNEAIIAMVEETARRDKINVEPKA